MGEGRMSEIVKKLIKDLDKLKFFLDSNDVNNVKNDKECVAKSE